MERHAVLSQPQKALTAPSFFFPVEESLAHPAQLSRLELEKDLLETGLANCVTYLQALRKKQARNERRLVADSTLPRKKKKKIQQSMRDLEKEIANRERDEQAFLHNLQACKANVYLAETVSSPSTTVASTIPDLASNSTLCSYPEESEPAESSWTGCAYKTASSPSQTFLGNDIGPHGYSDTIELATGKITQRPLDVEQASATWPLPMTGTPTQFVFSPEAALFEPQTAPTDWDVELNQQLARLRIVSPKATTTSGGTCRRNSVERIVENVGDHAWVNATPRIVVRPRRSRTNSV
jgi:hypothetical protein